MIALVDLRFVTARRRDWQMQAALRAYYGFQIATAIVAGIAFWVCCTACVRPQLRAVGTCWLITAVFLYLLMLRAFARLERLVAARRREKGAA